MSRRPHAHVLLGLVLILPSGAVAAQGTQPLSTTELTSKLAFDPLVRVGTLDNGLKYYIRANAYPAKRAELRLAVNAGSVLESPDQIGLAHMTEHMAFNGTAHFPKNDLVHYLQSIGTRFGADVNAYTSFDETVYMLSIPTDTGKFIQKGIEILSDWAHSQLFDSAEVEAERGVVIEEWRLRRGAGARMQDVQFPILLKGSRYADRLPIGNPDYLRSFPQAALRRFYQEWYRPEMMAVVAVGDFDVAAIEQQIKDQFGKIPKSPTPVKRPTYPVPPHDATYVTIATDREAPNSSFTIYNVLPPRDQSTLGAFRERYVQRLGMDMLNDRLQEVAQKPNPPFAFAGASRGYFIRAADAFTMSAGVKEGGVQAGVEAALTEGERAARFGFTQTELDRAKLNRERGQEATYAERDKQPSAARADEILRNFLNGEDVLGTDGEYLLYKRITPGITLAEVNQAMKDLLSDKNRVLLVNAPDKASTTLPTEAQLLAAFTSVKGLALEPYKDVISTEPLLAKIPAPVAIVSTRTIPQIGVTEWTLANGVKVVLKPTDYVADQIVLTSYSPGGSSLVPDSNYVSAMLASTAVSAGGVGNLSPAELRKLLTGKIASANASIGGRAEGISGTASPKDVETMFQLVYLRFTAPRKDSTGFAAFRQSMQAMLANNAATPQSAFSDTLTATLTQHAFRARPLSPALLNEVKYDQAFKIYQDRFADASDFTFFLVGNFTLDSIKPLVQRYLGGLPSINRKEVAKDDGIRPPKGVIEKTVRRGVEPQSQTVIAFTAPYEYSAQEQLALSTLGQILSNRLIDKLREQLGGTYSVNAAASGSREEMKLATVVFQFGSAPERADELTKAIFAEIQSIKDNGPTAADLEKVREAQLRARETAVRTNGFWAGQLSNDWQYGDDPLLVLNYTTMVSALTTDAIRDAARKYIKNDNYIRVTLLPEVKVP